MCKILESVSAEADTLKFERYNIVSETGDSIYSPQSEEFTTFDDIGQVFISQAVIEVVNRIIDHHHKRLGPSLKTQYTK